MWEFIESIRDAVHDFVK